MNNVDYEREQQTTHVEKQNNEMNVTMVDNTTTLTNESVVFAHLHTWIKKQRMKMKESRR
jgi:hypothetical protein